MLGPLLGVTGKLKTLLDRLTSGRATALDYLDAAVTSRAAASTALSTAQWTNARAGYLDNIATPPATTFIQSIQTGTTGGGVYTGTSSGEDTTYYDTTISAVVVAKSIVLVQNNAPGGVYFMGRLTSTTNLRLGTNTASGGVSNVYVRWTVLEFV